MGLRGAAGRTHHDRPHLRAAAGGGGALVPPPSLAPQPIPPRVLRPRRSLSRHHRNTRALGKFDNTDWRLVKFYSHHSQWSCCSLLREVYIGAQAAYKTLTDQVRVKLGIFLCLQRAEVWKIRRKPPRRSRKGFLRIFQYFSEL